MKWYVLSVVISLVNVLCLGAMEKVPSHDELIKLHEKSLKVFGGYIAKPDPGNGWIHIENKVNTISSKKLKHILHNFRCFHNVDIRIGNDFDPVAKINIVIENDNLNSSVILVSPEEFRAVLNVAPLLADKPSDAKFINRIEKELVRTIAYVSGGGGSRYTNTLIGPIRSLRQLDAMGSHTLPPDSIASISTYLNTIGIRPIIVLPYSSACQEGWAPAPTNEYQKAIWEKVHALPKNPMKIEFDPKKGR